MSTDAKSALCGTCGSAPGEPCRDLARGPGNVFPRHVPPCPVVGAHLARLHRVLSREARR